MSAFPAPRTDEGTKSDPGRRAYPKFCISLGYVHRLDVGGPCHAVRIRHLNEITIAAVGPLRVPGRIEGRQARIRR